MLQLLLDQRTAELLQMRRETHAGKSGISPETTRPRRVLRPGGALVKHRCVGRLSAKGTTRLQPDGIP
ncbi:hypothetical protein GCM10009727_04590 [Actinomadura napierensis]|uniref:Uncharacterized protein n=1 Tax=Actinomadura napierensis TaxID=267854 RepID=A0ABN2XZZ3_9ACTN